MPASWPLEHMHVHAGHPNRRPYPARPPTTLVAQLPAATTPAATSAARYAVRSASRAELTLALVSSAAISGLTKPVRFGSDGGGAGGDRTGRPPPLPDPGPGFGRRTFGKNGDGDGVGADFAVRFATTAAARSLW